MVYEKFSEQKLKKSSPQDRTFESIDKDYGDATPEGVENAINAIKVLDGLSKNMASKLGNGDEKE